MDAIVGSVINNIQDVNTELRHRTQAINLPFECGAGGLFNAEIAFVAEAPGEREVALRSPLVGGSGKVLWDSLRREGLGRGQVYITNVVKRRLVSTGDHAGKPKDAIGRGELEHWQAILRDELAHLPNLKLVVALGNMALNAFTGQDGITKWRGSVLDVNVGARQVKLLATFNPALILREPKNEVVFKMDLHKITRVMRGEYAPPQFTEIINPSPREALDYIHRMQTERVPISYDIEIQAGETACVGLCNSPREGMCINFRDQTSNRWSLAEERDVRLALQRMFADHACQFIAQNGNFDSYWLWYKDRIKVHANWFDTMLAHHLLYPPLPHNLGFITAQYTDHPYYKDDGKDWRESGDIDEFWRYNVKDCVITRMAALSMLGELRQQGLDQFFFNHIMKLQPHLVRMTVGGIKCDATLKGRFTEELAQQLERKRLAFIDACRTATGRPDYTCNPRSTRDLGHLFFTELRLVGRGASTDAENRKRMRDNPRTPETARQVLVSLDDYAADAKFLSTYATATVDDDGRFRCEYKQTGVAKAPGRLSSSQVMWGSGLNLQNIPELAKPMFVCDPGYEFSYFDASQIEARIVAYVANIPRWKEQFELARLNPGSYDAHCALAADMFKVPYDDVPRHDREPDGRPTIRYTAKRCRHGLNYRMGVDRLATVTGLPLRTAADAYERYHRTTPEIRKWWDDTISTVKRQRYLETPFGRRWVLLERLDDDALDSIVAFVPQSTAGDKVASVIYKSERDPRWPRDARLALNVHDALIAINRPEDGPTVRAIFKEYMEEPIIINGERLIIPAEFAVSMPDDTGVHRWSTLKKVK